MPRGDGRPELLLWWLLPVHPQFLNDGLTFAGAMLVNQLVRHLESAQTSAAGGGGSATTLSAQPSSSSCQEHSVSAVPPLLAWCPAGSPCWGYCLAALLGLSAVLKAIIGSHYNFGLNLVTAR
jgi:hypothetical protein